MHLATLHHRPTINNWRPSNQLEILSALLGLYGLSGSMGGIVEVATNEVTWPAAWSDSLFVPPRNFESRRRARRFLNWLIDRGVDARPWLDHLEDPQNHPATPTPKPWGGYVGRAYPIGDRVVKFTTDRNEAGLAAALEGRKSPHLATIYGVINCGNAGSLSGGSKELYAIIQERLNTGVGHLFRQAGAAVYDYLDRFSAPIDDARRVAELIYRDYTGKRQSRPDQNQGVDTRLQWTILEIVKAIKDVYDKLGIMYLDPHGANLGLKGRNVAFFDLGRSTGHHGRVGGLIP